MPPAIAVLLEEDAGGLRSGRQGGGFAGRGRHPRHLVHRALRGAAARGLGGDQHVADLLDAGELVDRAHQEPLRALFESSAGDVDVLLLQALDHGLDRKVKLRQLLLVDVDLNLVLEAAADLHRGHAVDRFELLLQVVVGVAAQVDELAHRIGIAVCAHIAGQGEP